MTNPFQKRGFANFQVKKREEKEEIKMWADSGAAENISNLLKTKYKSDIDPKTLPF